MSTADTLSPSETGSSPFTIDYITAKKTITTKLDEDMPRSIASPRKTSAISECDISQEEFLGLDSSDSPEDTVAAQNKQRTYRGVDLSTIPEIPENAQLQYVAEGAANIIYRFTLQSSFTRSTGGILSPDIGSTHLLRLRKALPSGSRNLPAFAALNTVFFPLFPKEFVLDTRIVKIPGGLIDRENEILKKREACGQRLSTRTGLYLVGPPPAPGTPVDENGERSTAYERYALLVEDMTPAIPTLDQDGKASHREVLVEFKPKWLAQSPSAPKGARRCRTCALRISKHFKKRGTIINGNGAGTPGHWCPFYLASGDPDKVRLAVQGILSSKGAVLTGWKKPDGGKGDLSDSERSILEDKIVRYFVGSQGKQLLELLRKYQQEWDSEGPAAVFGENDEWQLEPNSSDEDGADGEWGDEWHEGVKKFLMAMTVRDLTLFLKIDLSKPSPPVVGISDDTVQGRIGDLDLKSPDNGKAKYWIEVEKRLNDEGWYKGTERHIQRPNSSRKVSTLGDKRKHEEVEGTVIEGRKISGTCEPVEVIVERERDEEGLGGANGQCDSNGQVRWCIL
ncbi:inositol-pentakisphosphate 2-kinase-domain-containing protein [Kalaharituber pfeilii]|nr:inositol-pentakisphosphate 2-kinase-domain-containing protein [Kalaharituber pfeilii]